MGIETLVGRVSKHDQGREYHLAPASLRPIFLRVLLDCMVPAAVV